MALIYDLEASCHLPPSQTGSGKLNDLVILSNLLHDCDIKRQKIRHDSLKNQLGSATEILIPNVFVSGGLFVLLLAGGGREGRKEKPVLERKEEKEARWEVSIILPDRSGTCCILAQGNWGERKIRRQLSRIFLVAHKAKKHN